MRRSLIFTCALASCLGLAVLVARPTADSSDADFGLFISDQLREHSEQLFGSSRPLAESARGPYDGADNTKAIQVARGLTVSLISSSVASAADQLRSGPTMRIPRICSCATRKRRIQPCSVSTCRCHQMRTPRRSSPVFRRAIPSGARRAGLSSLLKKRERAVASPRFWTPSTSMHRSTSAIAPWGRRAIRTT